MGRRAKRRIFYVVVLVALVAGAGFFIHSLPAMQGSGIEGVVTRAISAIPGGDIEKVVENFTPMARTLMIQRLQGMYAYGDIDIENLETILLYEDGRAARVNATYDIILMQGGYTDTQHCNKNIKLILNTDEKWYINEAF